MYCPTCCVGRVREWRLFRPTARWARERRRPLSAEKSSPQPEKTRPGAVWLLRSACGPHGPHSIPIGASLEAGRAAARAGTFSSAYATSVQGRGRLGPRWIVPPQEEGEMVAEVAPDLGQVVRFQGVAMQIIELAPPGGGPVEDILHHGWARRCDDELEAAFGQEGLAIGRATLARGDGPAGRC